MQTLYLLRHAETTTGSGKFVGHTDVDLSAFGHQCAAALPQHWTGVAPTVVCTSALRRAGASVAALCRQLNLCRSIDAGFNEMNFGQWEGLSWTQIERQSAEMARLWSDNWVDTAAPGGECLRDVHLRATASLNRLLKLHTDAPAILVVAHAGSIRALLCELLNKPLSAAFDGSLDYLARYELGRDSAAGPWQLRAANVQFARRS